MNLRNFFAELKRRNVYKVAVAYAVVAWLLIQAASILFPTFDAPPWAMKVLVVVIVIGFPLALIVSWAFEITPEGVKLESEIAPNESIRKRTGRKIVGITVALAILAAVLLAYRIWAPKGETKALTTATPALASILAAKNSVAVLPFENLSDDKGNEYFSDGISEELLTVLQKIPGLRVSARTSSFSFKGKNATAQEIGEKLGVANLVEGSVRKVSNTVRIAARLSRAASGEELWSENYTRDLKDVFAVQSELAQTIVGQLRGQLGEQNAAGQIKASVRDGTTNPEAYEQYLQGRYYLNRFSVEDLARAITFLQRACELDPNFASAWAALSRARAAHTGWTDRTTREQFRTGLSEASDAADRALKLDPELPEALNARFEIQFTYNFQWKAGAETIRRAQALAPSDPMILKSAALVAVMFGDYARAVELAHQAVSLDPVNPEIRAYLGIALLQARRPAESRSEFERVEELNPATPWAFAGRGMADLHEGKNAEALALAERDTGEFARLVVSAVALWNLNRKAESDAALARMIKFEADGGAFQIAEVYSGRGDKDQAFAWLERARRQQDGGLAYYPNDPLLDSLHSDSRWVTFQRSMGWAEDQLK